MDQSLNPLFSPIVENAIRLASYWHKGQMRKGREFEYFTHPVAVSLILARAGFEEEVVAAGLCHDLIEDTNCPSEELLQACGQNVLNYVLTVTENKQLDEDKDWEIIKKLQLDRVRAASWQAKAVFTADKIHNLQTLMAALEEYGLSYFNYFHRGPEQKLWIEDQRVMMLQESWKHPLVDEYDQLVDEFVETLEDLDVKAEQTGQPYKHVYQSQQTDFDDPEAIQKTKASLVKRQVFNQEQLAKIVDVKVRQALLSKPKPVKKKPKKTLGKYLIDNEYRLLLPVALHYGIAQGSLTNPDLQNQLQISYLTAFKILKELKRLHVVKRADSFKPRPVNKTKAREVLAGLQKKKQL
ncbi:bifunctional (p)ppGpp synthetase/guanosine-3',5'-bis(diphosphate) 3'-pyrophosphohydrolase [Candidatus Beckwithbacteria bacterium]|nr:bifunctional (p)ppGpp synthetase/guanosine-3',5'-bis(diphosphate) 3'-pyrophosphohydrolase [Candidatus Beckwithbacteria bacterium]